MENEKKRGRGRGRGRGGRGRARGRGRAKSTPTTRGRNKKMVIESDEEQIETCEIVDNEVVLSDNDDQEDEMVIDEREVETESPEDKEKEQKGEKVEYTLDDDISQLVPPTFSTVSKGPPQPMLELPWNHKYTPIADKLPTPNIHMCTGCNLPIRIYGRLIPCKHVYCNSCAPKLSHCSCCNDRVSRVEQAHLGQVFMCHHGGTRYGLDGCRRTYLSQRDLQAHVDHRHKPRSSIALDHGSRGPLSSFSHDRGRSSDSGNAGSRYERKSSFGRSSWSYNSRPY